MRRCTAVLFDLDNTLYDRDASFRGWAAWFARRRLGLLEEIAHRAAVEELVARDSHGYCPRPEFFGWLKQRHPALTATTEALIADFYHDHLAHLARDDATDCLLDALATTRRPFGIITNGSANQLRKIERLGLTDRAACVFVSALFGCRKPEAAIFLAAVAALDRPAAEILFVGDSNPSMTPACSSRSRSCA
jgi:putative hydrolase of the HAD superfamily